MTRRRPLVAALAVALVVAATSGCSDDDGEGPPEGGAPTTTTSLVFSGDAGSAFCQLLRDVQVGDGSPEPAATPEELEARYTDTIEILTEAAEQAPPELQTDVGLVLEGFVALDGALRAVGYSFAALEQSPGAAEIAQAVNDPAFRVAGDRITAYRTQVCDL